MIDIRPLCALSPKAWLCLTVLLPMVCVSCGSVEIGQDHYYRLGQAHLAKPSGRAWGTLRIEDFALSPHLAGDQVLVQEGASKLTPYRYHYWAAPLDRMVTDSIYRAFLVSRHFEAILDARDQGEADWVLGGRILEFQEVRVAGSGRGRVRLACTLRTEAAGRTLWQAEIEQEVASRGDTALAVVEALDRALGKALEEIAIHAEERMREASIEASPGK